MTCSECAKQPHIDITRADAGSLLERLPGVKTVAWHEQYAAWVVVHKDGTEITMPVRPRPTWTKDQTAIELKPDGLRIV